MIIARCMPSRSAVAHYKLGSSLLFIGNAVPFSSFIARPTRYALAASHLTHLELSSYSIRVLLNFVSRLLTACAIAPMPLNHRVRSTTFLEFAIEFATVFPPSAIVSSHATICVTTRDNKSKNYIAEYCEETCEC